MLDDLVFGRGGCSVSLSFTVVRAVFVIAGELHRSTEMSDIFI